jgi:2-polyprenyl-3-methyl-5-hydroxy-6-metoxy-1,4-benzoquinol methylase
MPQQATEDRCRVQTETLEVLASAKNYNRWILESFQHVIGDRVLEIGCGTGTFTRMLLDRASHVTAMDVNPGYTEIVRTEVEAPPGKTLEVRCENFMQTWETLGSFDAIVMLNVLEHIGDDAFALETLRKLLKPEGRLVLLVPALPVLYSDYDQSIHHYRRYTRETLTGVLEQSGMRLEKIQYFNLLGILGWWWNFKMCRKLEMDMTSVGLFEKLVPMLRAVEETVSPPIGLSLVAIARH